MGSYFKYLIPLFLIGLGAVIFQNCGQTLQANGDPYEDRINLDDPFIDDPANAPGDGQTSGDSAALGFTADTTCLPTTSGGALHTVSLGKKGADDAVFIQSNEGPMKVYNWPTGQSPLTLNHQLTKKLVIQTVEYDSVNSLVRVQVVVNGVTSQEVLACD